MSRIKVIQGEKEIPTEILAESIQAIADGMKKMRNGRLNDRAIIMLIQHSTSGISQRQIKDVLNSIENLASTYLRKK